MALDKQKKGGRGATAKKEKRSRDGVKGLRGGSPAGKKKASLDPYGKRCRVVRKKKQSEEKKGRTARPASLETSRLHDRLEE